MLSSRHYDRRTQKLLDKRWLFIKRADLAAKFRNYAAPKERESCILLAVLSVFNAIFNACLCVLIP